MNSELTVENYHTSLTSEIPAKEAFRKIQQVWLWWTSNFEGSSSQVGDRFTVRFAATYVTFLVKECVEGQKMVWVVDDCHLDWLQDKKEWNTTQLVWVLRSEGNVTRIDFTHMGLVPGLECYGDCKKGWNFYAKDSLLKLLREGIGLPETPKDQRG